MNNHLTVADSILKSLTNKGGGWLREKIHIQSKANQIEVENLLLPAENESSKKIGLIDYLSEEEEKEKEVYLTIY